MANPSILNLTKHTRLVNDFQEHFRTLLVADPRILGQEQDLLFSELRAPGRFDPTN